MRGQEAAFEAARALENAKKVEAWGARNSLGFKQIE
jgi:hypothetical protein